MKKIVLFASGSGSNVENIINYFKDKSVQIVGVYTNNPNAYVIQRAEKYGITAHIFTKTQMSSAGFYDEIVSIQPDLIVLAGFLLKFPEALVNAFPNKIINIHPALLPKYGGKGMYGMHVHEAVIANCETETGITIHYVNEHYDEGEFIFQTSVGIENCKTAHDVAEKIHELEQAHFPIIIDNLLK
jgi:phosphoribosylglycinamide formyltransferase 1